MKRRTIVMTVKDFPFMADCEGRDLIVTDGTTLLGGDDKAGVAEIMTMAAWLLAHPEIPHGTIRIGFTPDEEVGRGADFFDGGRVRSGCGLYGGRRSSGRAGI